MGKTHNKKIISIMNNINSNPTKICFYKLYIGAKIMHHLSSKPISLIITKMVRYIWIFRDFFLIFF